MTPLVLTFRARQDLGIARHNEISRAGNELARSRRWWCGAPCVWVTGSPLRAQGMLELTFGWDRDIDRAMAAHDLALVLAWMRGFETSWEIEIPGLGTAVIGANVPAPLATPLEALERSLVAHGAIDDAATVIAAHPDRYGEITQPARWTSRGMGERAEYVHLLLGQVVLAADPDHASLAQDAAAIGQSGRAGVWSWVAETEDPRRIADRMALALDLTPLGAAWVELTAERALALLSLAIHKDLAYGTKREDAAAAGELATAWLACAGAGAHLFTNGNWAPNFTGTSNPIGTATFDLAFANVGPERGALVWIGDED